MNSQMTLLALGGKCGRPSGGVQAAGAGDAVALEHRPERQPGEAHAEVGQKLRVGEIVGSSGP